MNTTKNGDGGPAFLLTEEGWEHLGLSKREYAAIHLRVPDSGNEMIDDMIRASMRDDFAGQALVGIHANDGSRSYLTSELAVMAYDQADEMVTQREGESDATIHE